MTTHLDLWGRLEKTDPTYTKPFSRGGGFKGTAINATYTVRRLTEAFGPCGKGWRFVLDEERIEEGHTLKSGDKAKIHIVRGHISYVMDGTWYDTSPQFGQTMLVDENKYGVFTDEEAPKKSITDCIGKCAVLLGVGADIHLGRFDDNKYVNERRAEVAGEQGNGNPERVATPKRQEPKRDATPDDLGATDYKAALRGFEIMRNSLLTTLRGGEITPTDAEDRYREIREGSVHYEVNGKGKSISTAALLKQCARSREWRDDDKADFVGFERRLRETREELDRAKASAPVDDPFAEPQEAAQ